ncbi:RNA polymerase sigma factor, sigma-70 family [Lachnospiraceae bacterium NK3A20]|nr:RNA polymerase sigma factor, sigma-70 family [Lachnospiraceae bacterium NK3A20]
MVNETKYLLQRALERDPDAFTQLMQLQMQNMYRTAFAILMNDEDAADAIQDTILILWEKLPTIRNPEYFRTWYTRILINRCLDMKKIRRGMCHLQNRQRNRRQRTVRIWNGRKSCPF